MSQYQKLISQLFQVNLHGGIKLGLRNVGKLLQYFDHPEKRFKTIHIAGTNGKGSVTTKIAKGLEAATLRVGLFTSPHISCFRERIQINGLLISEEDICEWLSQIFSAQKKLNLSATFFELTTVIAFCHFAKKEVDIAVVETGLGGKLDATNVILPELAVITSISLDHTEILGETLEKITFEKAGIIKPTKPVVIGPTVSKKLIEPIAKKLDSPLYVVSGLFKSYDEENQAIASKAMEVFGLSKTAIDSGVQARPPCRQEKFSLSSTPVILDAAHNSDGLNRLFMGLDGSPPYQVICGLSSTKDIQKCLSIIAKAANELFLVEASNGRGFSKQTLQSALIELGFPEEKVFLCDSVSHAFALAKNDSQCPIIVTGSFFIMAEARKALGVVEPCDPIDLNEKFSLNFK